MPAKRSDTIASVAVANKGPEDKLSRSVCQTLTLTILVHTESMLFWVFCEKTLIFDNLFGYEF